jgi:hypothetical protein
MIYKNDENPYFIFVSILILPYMLAKALSAYIEYKLNPSDIL